MKVKTFKLIWIGLSALFFLTACSPWTVANQVNSDGWLDLDSGSPIGQTFVADYDGLQAVQLLLAPQEPGLGKITLHVKTDPDSIDDIYTGGISAEDVTGSQYYRFDFTPIADSSDRYYYVFLEMEGDGRILTATGPPGSYHNGSAYINHKPIRSQLAFKLDYDRAHSYPGILSEVSSLIGELLFGILLLTVPGWAVLSINWRGWTRQYFFTKLAISIGTSFCIYIILVLYTSLFNMQLGLGYALIPLFTGSVILTWKNKSTLINYIDARKFTINVDRGMLQSYAIPNITFFIVILVLLFTRTWQMRGLEAPLWGDSIQHTAIVQLLVDHKGLFDNWAPYAPYDTFSMHFGFPLIAALLAWTSELSSSQSVLLAGQVLNVASVVVLYPLGVRLANGNRWAGVMAVLGAGLLSPMPAFYTNWGRYAQLAGQVVLPILMWMLWDVFEDVHAETNHKWYTHLPWGKIIISGFTLTGLVLCQFRMPYYLMTFLIAWIIGWSVKHWGVNITYWLRMLFSLVLIGIIGSILFAPWALRIIDGNLISLESMGAARPDLIRIIKLDYQQWKDLFIYISPGLLMMAIFGSVVAIIRKDWLIASISLWAVLLASIYSLQIFDMPGAQFVTSFSVLIAMYIPVSLLFGEIAGKLSNLILRLKLGNVLIGVTAVLIASAGAWSQRNLIQEDQYAMVTRPDILAMDWIRENTPTDSRFLVEGFRAYWNTSAVGADAGWWIPIFTQRGNTMPPQYALTDETPSEEGYSEKVVALVAELDRSLISSSASQMLICDMDVTHVYIGQKQGMVGNPGLPLFTQDELDANPNYNLEYQQDGVYIYSLNEAACGE